VRKWVESRYSPAVIILERARAIALVALAPSLLIACSSDDGIELLVDARTDLAPGIEFLSVSASLDGATPEVVPAVRGDAFDTGRRIAGFAGLGLGDHTLLVALRDGSGAVVVERTMRLAIERSVGVTVVLARGCVGMACPASGGVPLTCHGGRCVPPECSSLDTFACGSPECASAGDCGTAAECAMASCANGVCLSIGRDSDCGPSEWCDPARGCLAVAEVFDGYIDSLRLYCYARTAEDVRSAAGL